MSILVKKYYVGKSGKASLKEETKKSENMKKAKELVEEFYKVNPRVKLEDAKKAVKEHKEIKKAWPSMSLPKNHIDLYSQTSDDASSIKSSSSSE